MCVDQNPTLPQRPPTRYQRRSPAERSFALNGSPEQPEFRESPLQTLPRDLLRAHVFEGVSLWDLGRLGCAASWLAETVFDDQKAWERRNGLLVGGLRCMHSGVLGATRAGRVAEWCWTGIMSAATEAPRPATRTPYCAASYVAVNIEARRRAETAAVAARHGAPCALPPQGGRARAASRSGAGQLSSLRPRRRRGPLQEHLIVWRPGSPSTSRRGGAPRRRRWRRGTARRARCRLKALARAPRR